MAHALLLGRVPHAAIQNGNSKRLLHETSIDVSGKLNIIDTKPTSHFEGHKGPDCCHEGAYMLDAVCTLLLLRCRMQQILNVREHATCKFVGRAAEGTVQRHETT